MTRMQAFETLAKSAGFGAVAKAIVDNDGDPCISPRELSDLLKAECSRRGVSFADVYSANTDEGRNIRKAFNIAQQAEWYAQAKSGNAVPHVDGVAVQAEIAKMQKAGPAMVGPLAVPLVLAPSRARSIA